MPVFLLGVGTACHHAGVATAVSLTTSHDKMDAWGQQCACVSSDASIGRLIDIQWIKTCVAYYTHRVINYCAVLGMFCCN